MHNTSLTSAWTDPISQPDDVTDLATADANDAGDGPINLSVEQVGGNTVYLKDFWSGVRTGAGVVIDATQAVGTAPVESIGTDLLNLTAARSGGARTIYARYTGAGQFLLTDTTGQTSLTGGSGFVQALGAVIARLSTSTGLSIVDSGSGDAISLTLATGLRLTSLPAGVGLSFVSPTAFSQSAAFAHSLIDETCPRAWGNVQTDGAGNVNAEDGVGYTVLLVTDPNNGANKVIQVTLATACLGPAYDFGFTYLGSFATAALGTDISVMRELWGHRTASSVLLKIWSDATNSATAVNPASVDLAFTFRVFGRQG